MHGITTTTSHGEVRWTRTELYALTPDNLILFGASRVLQLRGKQWSPDKPTVMTLNLRDMEDGTQSRIDFGLTETVRLVVGIASDSLH